ncbi:helix-turn-helix domain-containing protein, partial [Actinomadura adrarensis]
ADSLRWARRTLALVDAGILSGTGLARAEDHLLELWLLSDQALLDELERRVLDVPVRKGPVRRMRLTETLCAWLESESNAVGTAERLDVHPQTVRYRMKQINDLYGDQLADPDARFSLEAVLRAGRLRDRATANARSAPESRHVARG